MTPAEPETLIQRATDERGRAIPLTDLQIRQRAERAIEALNSLDDMGDEEEQRETLDALIRGIDEHPLSDRPRFGPCD